MRIAVFVLGFFCSILITVGLVDFGYQTYQSGKSVPEFGLTGWVDSVARRGVVAAKQRKVAEAQPVKLDDNLRSLLPAAPSGWLRQTWSTAQRNILTAPKDAVIPSHDELEELALRERDPSIWRDGMLGVSDFGSRAGNVSKKESDSTWVYTRGKERVVVTIRRLKPPREPANLHEAVAKRVAAESNWDKSEVMFAKIRGVIFAEILRESTHTYFRTFVSKLSPTDDLRIEIKVRARARDKTIKTVLKGIDLLRIRRALERDTQGMPAEELRKLRTAEHVKEAELRRLDLGSNIERRLTALERSAAQGTREVCVVHKGRRHCKWVDQ